MKSAVVTFLLGFAAFVLQTAFFPKIFLVLAGATGLRFLTGQTVNLTLIMLVYLALNRDLSGTLIWALLFGIMGQAFGTSWNGALATGFFVTAGLCSLLRRQIFLRDALSMGLFMAAMLFIEGVIHLLMGRYLHSMPQEITSEIGSILVQLLVSALAAPLVFGGLRWIDDRLGVFTQRSRRSLLLEV